MSTAAKTVPSRLADIVGAKQVSNDAAELRAYAVDGKVPAAAVRPGSAEEVAGVVKFAAAEKLAIIATGARTKLGIGLPPRQYDIAVDMTRLDRVVAFDPGDLTLSIEAGIPLHRLNGVLAEHRQFLPLAVPFMRQTTAGGTLASGVDSPLRQSFGTARDYLLGLEYVNGEGVTAKSGGRVVKNVTGYDLHKLMIGSLGTLGIITRMNFRTYPLPETTRGFVALFDNAERAINLRHRIAQSPLTPMTLDILSPRVAEILTSRTAERIAPGDLDEDMLSKKRWALTAGFCGNAKILERYATELHSMAAECGAAHISVVPEHEVPAEFSRIREVIPIALEMSPAATIVKASVLPMRMKEMVEAAGRIADGESVPWAAVARGLGVVYFALLPAEKDGETRVRVERATDQILATCAKLEGNAMIPWCPSEWKGTLKVWGPERADFPLTRKVKNVFDAPGILSPGRFVGGL
jgi:glycolate oxidase FAD binding subunit